MAIVPQLAQVFPQEKAVVRLLGAEGIGFLFDGGKSDMAAETTKKLRAAVAGSRWGAVHARGFARCPGAEMVGVWSRSDAPAGRGLARQMGVPFFTDYAKMLAEVKPDIVGVAVPEAAHEAMTVPALQAGAHVYCEKVLADSVPAARRMIAAAHAQGRQLGVGYNYRYSPSCRHLTALVKAGELGEILFAQLRAFTRCIHHMTDYALSLLGPPVRVSGFFEDTPLAGRPLISTAIHRFPTFSYGAFARKAYTIQCRSGALLMAAATDYTGVEEPAAMLIVQGSTGRAELDDLTGQVTVWRGRRDAALWRPSQICDFIGLEHNGVTSALDFAGAMASGAPAPISATAGLDMILLEEAIMRSAKSANKWEAIENAGG